MYKRQSRDRSDLAEKAFAAPVPAELMDYLQKHKNDLHPDFLKLIREYFIEFPSNAFLMRGVEGEAVVRLNAPQPIEEFRSDGSTVSHLIGETEAGYALPAREADATARWTRDILEGRTSVPLALARQVALIVEHCRTAANAGRPPLHLVSSK